MTDLTPFTGNGTYSCRICRRHLKSDEGWYDQYGIKCPVCQKAVEEGVVPGAVARDDSPWYSSDKLKDKFGWHHTTTAKKVRTGELKARHIKNGDRHWFYVFLKEENLNI